MSAWRWIDVMLRPLIFAVASAYLWVILIKQLRSGVTIRIFGDGWQRDTNPEKFGGAVLLTLVLAVISTLFVLLAIDGYFHGISV